MLQCVAVCVAVGVAVGVAVCVAVCAAELPAPSAAAAATCGNSGVRTSAAGAVFSKVRSTVMLHSKFRTKSNFENLYLLVMVVVAI